MKTKKAKKMDPLLVAKTKAEVSYISRKWKIPVLEVKKAMNLAGRSRAKIYDQLILEGWPIVTRRRNEKAKAAAKSKKKKK